MADENELKTAEALGRIEATLAAVVADHDRRIRALEIGREWIVRVVLGAVMLAVLGIVIGTKAGVL